MVVIKCKQKKILYDFINEQVNVINTKITQHTKAYCFYKNIDNSLSIGNICILSITSLIKSIMITTELDALQSLSISYACILWITTVIASIQKFSKFSDICNAHQIKQQHYTDLKRDIYKHLSNTKNVKIDSLLEFLQCLDELIISEPFIPFIVKGCEIQSGNVNLNLELLPV